MAEATKGDGGSWAASTTTSTGDGAAEGLRRAARRINSLVRDVAGEGVDAVRSAAIERLDTLEHALGEASNRLEQRGATYEHDLAVAGVDLTRRLGQELRQRSASQMIERILGPAAEHPVALAAGAFAAAFFAVRVVRS